MSRGGAALQPSQWLFLPALAAVLVTVLLSVPVRVLSLSPPEPVFPVALAFAWAVIRPSVLGPVLLLVLGLFLDLFWGGRLGVWGLSLMCAYGLTLGGRSLMAGQGPTVLALWYAAASGAAIGAAFLLATMVAHVEPNLFAVGWQFLWTLALYPIALWLIGRFEDADVRFR